jgi:hypothetical protein
MRAPFLFSLVLDARLVVMAIFANPRENEELVASVVLRDRSSQGSSTTRADAFEGANAKEEASARSGRNDTHLKFAINRWNGAMR